MYSRRTWVGDLSGPKICVHCDNIIYCAVRRFGGGGDGGGEIGGFNITELEGVLSFTVYV